MPDKDDRFKQIDEALAETLHPQVAKFAPKNRTDPPMASLIAQVRDLAQATLKLCDEMDKLANASETDLRKAADLMIAMGARIK